MLELLLRLVLMFFNLKLEYLAINLGFFMNNFIISLSIAIKEVFRNIFTVGGDIDEKKRFIYYFISNINDNFYRKSKLYKVNKR